MWCCNTALRIFLCYLLDAAVAVVAELGMRALRVQYICEGFE